MKYYQVIFVDEYNNWFELGFYKNLKDAEPDVNNYLDSYCLCEDDEIDPGAAPKLGDGPECNLGPLVEYAGTLGPVFDRDIAVEEGNVQVRGFIKDSNDTIDVLKKMEK